jgi:hypothetical protein
MKLKFSRQILGKWKYTKFHENPSSGSLVVPCGQTDDLRTGLTKLIVAFRNFASHAKNPPFMQPTAEVVIFAVQI